MTKTFVRIKSGSFRAFDVSGDTFQLLTHYKRTPKGGHIIVKNAGKFPGFPENIRIKMDGPQMYEQVDVSANVTQPVECEEDYVVETVQVASETDDEVISRIQSRFDILHSMTRAAISGDVRSVIVSGPPGVGKSYGVEQEVEKALLFDRISGKKLSAEVVKGSTTAIGLYCTLYKYRDPNSLLVFDDCDSLFHDPVSLNLLKGALDSGKRRKISWLSDSHMLRREGVPDSFDFRGSVIFITNIKFSNVRSKTLRDHLEALESRCHYIDLTLNDERDKFLRIKQVSLSGDLFSEYDLPESAGDEIIEFLGENRKMFREMSLRTALKLADLRKSFPLSWKEMSRVTVMKTEEH